jgi:hypothetical protein
MIPAASLTALCNKDTAALQRSAYLRKVVRHTVYLTMVSFALPSLQGEDSQL